MRASELVRYYRDIFPAIEIVYYHMGRQRHVDVEKRMAGLMKDDKWAPPFAPSESVPDIPGIKRELFVEYNDGSLSRYATVRDAKDLIAVLVKTYLGFDPDTKCRVATGVHLGPFIIGEWERVKRISGPLYFDVDVRSADYAAILPIECRLENNPHHPPRLCDRCWYLGFAAARLIMERLWVQLAITRACAYFSGSKGIHVEAYPDNDGFVEHFDEITKNPSTACPNRARYSVCQRLMYRDFPDEKSSHMVATCPTNQTQTGLCVDRKWMERLFEEKCVSENGMLEPRTPEGTIFSEKTVWTGIVNGIFGLLPQHFKTARGRLATIVGGRRNFKGSDRVARWRRFVEWCDQTSALNELKAEDERATLHILLMPRKIIDYFLAPRLDAKASAISHLLRCPFTPNPKTGLLKIPFDPFIDESLDDGVPVLSVTGAVENPRKVKGLTAVMKDSLLYKAYDARPPHLDKAI